MILIPRPIVAPTPALPSLKTRLKHGIKTVFTIKTSLYKGFKRKRECEELVVRRDHSSGRQPSPRGSPARKYKCVSVAAGLGRGGAGHSLQAGRERAEMLLPSGKTPPAFQRCLLPVLSPPPRGTASVGRRWTEPGHPSPPAFLGCYLAEGAMELPPAHDELGLLLANEMQAAQIPN